ncbi:MAG: hypothetical protein HWE30_03240 [Methylocystaceae bacterium]|nr:hypothetical protein [Methylocystaceae bacterium]
MRNFLLKNLSIISHKERAAKRVTFHPQVTTIIGGEEKRNTTGKSSLLKSIYWTLGAEPAKQSSVWQEAEVSTLLEAEVQGQIVTFFRTGNRFAIFDESRNTLLNTSNVTKQLSPFIAKLLDFHLQLSNHQGETQTPTPAFCFLPFYMDQDQGWVQPWQSFSNLSQFSRWKKETIYYHSGIRPNEYYGLKAEIDSLKADQKEINSELKALEKAFKKVLENKKKIPINFNPSEYRVAINKMLMELNYIAKDRRNTTVKLSEKSSNIARLEQQLSVANSALSEIDEDYNYISNRTEEIVTCPTCGTDHENSIVNRYSLIDDRESCKVFIFNLHDQIDKEALEIRKLQKELNVHDFRVRKLEQILEEKRGKLKLKDIIDAEGERKLEKLLSSQINEARSELGSLLEKQNRLNRELRKITDKKRQEEIETFFYRKMVSYLNLLEVENVKHQDVEKIDCRIQVTGNEQSRTVLSYYFAFLQTLTKYTDGSPCPIVIDTPLQQDPDPINIRRILNFILQKKPENSQLILSTGSMHGIDTIGSTITLENRRLLTPEEYELVNSIISEYTNAILHEI